MINRERKSKDRRRTGYKENFCREVSVRKTTNMEMEYITKEGKNRERKIRADGGGGKGDRAGQGKEGWWERTGQDAGAGKEWLGESGNVRHEGRDCMTKVKNKG